MRRVYDDEKFVETKAAICNIIRGLRAEDISKYSGYTWRINASLAYKKILKELNKDGEKYMYGKLSHAGGIGNNNEYEVIWLGNPAEQQICCLLHITEGLYGEGYLFVTDIDGERKSTCREMRGKERR